MANPAIELSNSLASIVEQSSTSVVQVRGRRRAPATAAVWSADGVLVSANHSLEWEEDIEVTLPDGKTASANVVGRDPTTDLAALRLSAAGLTPARWKDADALKVGHLVLSVFRPGRTARASLGIVSALGESWRTPSGGRLDRYLQTDIALQRGFSGSLLLDLSGGAVGLNTSGILRGASLAVPASTVRRVVEQLLAHGTVRRGFLGIVAYSVRVPASLESAGGQSSGLLLVSVQPESPAERAGLMLGDVLLEIEGQAVREIGDLLPFLDADRVGSELKVSILRAGERREVVLTVIAKTAG